AARLPQLVPAAVARLAAAGHAAPAAVPASGTGAARDDPLALSARCGRITIVADELGDLCLRVWRSLGGAAEVVAFLAPSGPRGVLPAYFDVTGLATASVAAATLAAAEFLAAREVSRPRPVSVDSRAAC